MEDLLEGLLTAGGHHALLVHRLFAVGLGSIGGSGIGASPQPTKNNIRGSAVHVAKDGESVNRSFLSFMENPSGL